MEKSLSAREYGLMALVALAIGVGLLVYYVRQVPNLEPGVRNQVYYVVLFPSALACAVALFGAMHGYARLTAKSPGVVLELGGPAVLFVLVLWGGFKLVPPPADTFDLTVRAHSADGTVSTVKSGQVVLDLDNDRRTQSFNPNGEADFKGIPGKFQGPAVKVLARVEGYQEKWEPHQITGTVLDLALSPAPPAAFRGFVQDETGGPLAAVHVVSTDCNAEADTNATGTFTLQIQSRFSNRCHLVFTKNGYEPYDTDTTMDQDPDHRFLLRGENGQGTSRKNRKQENRR